MNTAMQHPSPRTRLDDIDLAKGLAIILVVWGHIVAGPTPLDNDWYAQTKSFIYLFHMPFFMFLSGVVAGYGYQPISKFATWLDFVKKKLARLLPAYLLFGTVIVVGKLIAAKFVYVDNVPSSLLGGLWDVVTMPLDSGAKSLWFIYVLFLFYLTLHPWMILCRQHLIPLLVIGFMLQFVAAPDVLLLGTYAKFFFFFTLGLASGMHHQRFRIYLQKASFSSVILFLLSLVIAYKLPVGNGKLIVGLASIPALLYIINKIKSQKIKQTLNHCGRYSFVIYLLNTICIGVVKAVGLKIHGWDGNAFFVFAPALFAGGVLLPIYIKQYVLSRNELLNRITQ